MTATADIYTCINTTSALSLVAEWEGASLLANSVFLVYAFTSGRACMCYWRCSTVTIRFFFDRQCLLKSLKHDQYTQCADRSTAPPAGSPRMLEKRAVSIHYKITRVCSSSMEFLLLHTILFDKDRFTFLSAGISPSSSTTTTIRGRQLREWADDVASDTGKSSNDRNWKSPGRDAAK